MKIIKNITVIMHDGSMPSTTYPKRAGQLVKNDRAFWSDATTICMKAQRKDIDMAKANKKVTEIENIIVDESGVLTQNDIPTQVDDAVLDNTKVLYEATRRVEEKNRIVVRVIDFLCLALYGIIMVASWDEGVRIVVTMFYLLFYGIRLLTKINKYLKSSTTKKLKEYLEDRKEREIRIAYEKILESEQA